MSNEKNESQKRKFSELVNPKFFRDLSFHEGDKECAIPSKLFRPHPSDRGRVFCFFSRSGIAVIWNDAIETQKKTISH